MNYKEVENWLCNELPFFQNQGLTAYKENLDNINRLLKAINNPQNNFKSIHVAGTNGKGSVSYMLSKLLREGGYKVGLFTSPHLLTFRERIQLDNNYIDEDSVMSFVKSYRSLNQSIKFSFFEFTTAMAFWYFNEKKVDVAIIECGLGGRLDSTNIINPILSIITSISLDHSNILGRDIILIAKEKGGIIKKNTPVLISSQNKDNVINLLIKKASKLSSPFFISKKINQSNNILERPMYQAFNIELVKSALFILINLGFNFSEKKYKNTIDEYRNRIDFLGRWTIIKKEPLIICDIAHNMDAIKSVFLQLKKENRKKHIVLGFSSDKNLVDIFKQINLDATYYFCSSSNPRVLNPKKYISLIKSLRKKFFIFKNAQFAIAKITEGMSKDDLIFVTGSTFVVADVLSNFR